MLSNATTQKQTTRLLQQHLEVPPSSIHLSGRRPPPNYESKPSKQFKPNLNVSKIPSPSDTIQEGPESPIDPSNHLSPHSNHTMSVPDELGQSGGVEVTITDKENSKIYKEQKYLPPRGVNNLINPFNNGREETESTFSSPLTVVVESCENVTELNLDSSATSSAQESSPTVPQGVDWQEFLDKLRQEKGITCTDPSFKGEFLTFKCVRDHTFIAKRCEEIVCPKCSVIMEKCSEYAKLHKGSIGNNGLGKLLVDGSEEYLHFQCENNHIWKIKYSA